MFAKFALAMLLIGAPALAEESAPAPAPEIIAIDEDDAASCRNGCRQITERAFEYIAQRLRRAEEIEALAQRLAAELKRKPNPKFCL